MKFKGQSVLWWFVDRIFPLAQPPSPEDIQSLQERRRLEEAEWEARTTALDEDFRSLAEYLAGCEAAHKEEDQRQQSTDGRLTTIVGLSSVAGTIVFGTILANVQRGTPSLHWVIIVLLVYLTAQLGRAIFAGISGLERRTYKAMLDVDMLPGVKEARTVHVRRRIACSLALLAEKREQNNKKITHMAVAHCAIKNFIVGLLIVAVLASLYRPPDSTSDGLAEHLKHDSTLRELLRGPAGPPGPTGATGPTTATPASSRKPSKTGKQR